MKRTKLWDYAMVIGGALIATLILRSEFVEAYKIIPESMVPTLLAGDNVFANKFVYGLNLPFFNRKIFILTSPHREI
jgi:signal peptidase I